MTDLEILFQQAISRTNSSNSYDQGYQEGFSEGVDRLYSEIKFRLKTDGFIDKKTLKKICKDLKSK